MTTPAHIQAVLECPLPGAEGVPDGSTVRDYLKALLTRLWIEAEGFGGKRPFGNSGWQFDVYVGLVKAGLLAGQIDDDGYLDTVDQAAGDNLILAAIDALVSCDARIRPFRPITDLEVVCEDVEPAHGYHHGTIRDYAYPGSATKLGWYSSDRRGFTGDWPGPCTAKQGCILPARHLGKHAQ